jgi:hypothetical protein
MLIDLIIKYANYEVDYSCAHRHYICPTCSGEFSEKDVLWLHVRGGKIGFCPNCLEYKKNSKGRIVSIERKNKVVK